MSVAETSNAVRPGAMPVNGPPRTTRPSENGSATPAPADVCHPEELSESEFLARQAEEAKTAILDALADLGGDLKTAADLRLWARRHPWATLGVAALAGMTVADKLAAHAHAVANPRAEKAASPAAAPREGEKAATASAVEKASLLAGLFDIVWGIGRAWIGRTLAAAVRRDLAAQDGRGPTGTKQDHIERPNTSSGSSGNV